MRPSNYNRGCYRGRKTTTEILKIIAIVLGIMVAVLLSVLFFTQNYLVYTDDGIRVELPFFSQEEQENPPDVGEVSILESDHAAQSDENS